ncbi:MAG: CHAT domain-containing protein, partial [Pseudomonadota bacterium]|nr:CHAT domain-containing protein [Pseudomonadota bacterium]
MKKNTPASNAYLAGNLLLLNELNIRQQPFSLDATRQQRLNALNTQRFDSGVAPLAVRLQQLLEVDLLRHASMYASKTQTSEQVNEVTAGGMSQTLCDIQDCLAQVQASLGGGERVVLYVPAEQHIRAVVISADTVTLHAIAPLQTLVALAEEAALSVMQRRQDAERRLQTLAEQLFAPMLTEDSASTWIVAGHVPVNTVSLNALVASLPSPPAAFKRVMSSTRTVQNQNMASDSAAIRVLATQQINAQSGELAALDALPWAKVEAEQIQAAFAPQPIDVLLNNAATDEALFSEDTRQANILHIAAHNIYDPTEPDVVGLALNQASANGTGGTLIDIRAIEHSGFANNLVFLNACDTANGRDFDG